MRLCEAVGDDVGLLVSESVGLGVGVPVARGQPPNPSATVIPPYVHQPVKDRPGRLVNKLKSNYLQPIEE